MSATRSLVVAMSILVRAMAMISENMHRMSRGEAMAYTEASFDNLINHLLALDE